MLPLSQFTSCSAGPLPRAKLWFIQKPSDPSPSQHLHLVIRALSCFHWLQNTLFVATNSGQFVSIHCINTTLTFCGHKQRSVYPNLLYNTALISCGHKQFVWTNDKIIQCSGEGGEHPKLEFEHFCSNVYHTYLTHYNGYNFHLFIYLYYRPFILNEVWFMVSNTGPYDNTLLSNTCATLWKYLKVCYDVHGNAL